MPTRSVKLRLVVPRSGQQQQPRQDLWTTHHEMNRAIAAVEEVLILCRGGSYLGEKGMVCVDEVRRRALTFARSVQAVNGKPGAGSDEEVLGCLRQFYERLVPSVLLDKKGEPLTGRAQKSRALAQPMMDASSKAGLGCLDKIVDPLPAWVEAMERKTAGWEREAEAWRKSVEGTKVYDRKCPWVKLVGKGQSWHEAFVADQKKQRKAAGEEAALIQKMRDRLGLLPLLNTPIASRRCDVRGAMTPWDFLAVRLAVGHLISWESWNHRAAKEYAEIRAKVDAQSAKVQQDYVEAQRLIRDYECRRHQVLKRVAMADDERPYRIGLRSLREWERVYHAWSKPACRSESDRKAVLAELQAKLRGRFGDPDLLLWMAKEENRAVWAKPEAPVQVAKLNQLQRDLERKKQACTMTVADSRMHPRWTLYEYKSTNARQYGVECDRGRLTVKLPLLRAEGGKLREVNEAFLLAPSGQLESPEWDKGQVRFWSSHQRFEAVPGSADLLLSRRFVEERALGRLAEGEVGPVWIKLSLDVQSQAPDGWLDGRGRPKPPASFWHFCTSLAKKSKYDAELTPGLRVLSVDMGLRSFAACSVFELVAVRPEKGLYLPVGKDGLWAKHERSFLLKLPGEAPNEAQLDARQQAIEEVRLLKSKIRGLRDLVRLSGESEERAAMIEGWLNSENGLEASVLQVVSVEDLQSLRSHTADTQALWEHRVVVLHRQAVERLSVEISQWRGRTRPRSMECGHDGSYRAYGAHKSIWAVEYLTEVRKVLSSWSLRGRRRGEIRRADRSSRGVFARRLLEHINGLKDDRIKVGADLIVQAARGWVQLEGGGWMARFAPCHVIVMEELVRYRFSTDRPRRENSQLMQWCHREVRRVVEMQAELYGIRVGDVGAGFSSRFHSRSGAPGVRCRIVTAEDLKMEGFVERLTIELEGTGIEPGMVSAGCMVPWGGGELFASLGANGEVVSVHADINAAQNLQRRFWTRYADAYRVKSCGTDAEGRWVLEVNERAAGALGQLVEGCGQFVLSGSPKDGLVLGRCRGKERAVEAEEEGEEELEWSGQAGVFFRDPSGLVLDRERWYPQAVFWGEVRRRIGRSLLARMVPWGNPRR